MLRLMSALGLAAACTAALDWREVRPPESAVVALFPCKPDRFERAVRIEAIETRMQLLTCSAEAATYALGIVALDDASQAAPALEVLRAGALANLGATAPETLLWRPHGAKPGAQAVRWNFEGHLPNGTAVRQHTAFFAHGLRVYQASVVGVRPDAEAVQTFFAGLRIAP